VNTVKSLVHYGGGDVEVLDRLSRVIQQPWFLRAWVIQEAVLPYSAQVIIGSDLVPLGALFLAYKLLDNVRTEPYDTSLWHHNSFVKPQKGFFKTRLDGYTALSKISELQETRQMNAHPGDTTNVRFYKILEDFSSLCQASDPRDSIYASLGFQELPEITIQPNYSQSTQNVEIDVATAIIRGSGSLDQLGSHSPDENTFPSWVPNWRVPSCPDTHRINQPPHAKIHQLKRLCASKIVPIFGKVAIWVQNCL
jgi:hypothetical protein